MSRGLEANSLEKQNRVSLPWDTPGTAGSKVSRRIKSMLLTLGLVQENDSTMPPNSEIHRQWATPMNMQLPSISLVPLPLIGAECEGSPSIYIRCFYIWYKWQKSKQVKQWRGNNMQGIWPKKKPIINIIIYIVEDTTNM